MRLLVPFLLTACGESWTWDVAAKPGDTGDGSDSGAAPHDLDGDGFTGIAAGGDDCWDDPTSIPAAFEAISGTAQPTAAEVHPDATETWYDGVDADCAGDDDFDRDGDTHRSATHADGAGAIGDDCYDAVDDAYPSGAASCAREGDLAPAEVYPGAADLEYDGTDADCSGNDDFDQDGDGFGSCAECDDTDASIYPNDAADPWYDGVDANCDGNDGDQDGDGYYVEGYSFTIPADYEPGDCVDTDASTHPDAADAWYDGTDSNCLGDDDFDQDGDSYPLADDCDDTVATTFPGAPDAWYDGVDSDCLGDDDFDQDGDGYNSTDDCDDLDVGVNPAAAEDCATAYDDDCDGDDNDPDATGCVNYYSDLDGDGYGAASECLCAASGAYALATGADCDDADAAVSPGETEVCNDGVDNDCDGGAGACGLTGGSLSASIQYLGENADDYAGRAVAFAGDVDGDGYDDVLVGATNNADSGGGAGAAYLILGSASPASASLGSMIEFRAEAAGDSAGTGLSGAGDVDGDGLGDFVIGAGGNSNGGGAQAGALYLILGSTAPTAASLGAAIDYWGEAAGDYAGYAVSGAGDVNGDGLDDVIVGAIRNDDGASSAGTAYVVLGSVSPASASLSGAVQYTGAAADDAAGLCVASGGDVDGDGFADVVVSAPNNADGGGMYAGAAYLVLGSGSPASASLSTAVQFRGEAAGDYAGYGVGGAGDVNADGYDDLLIGAPKNTDGGGISTGAAYLVLGNAAPAGGDLSGYVQYTGENAGDSAGSDVAGTGDVDGDGYADMLVGAYGNADGGGAYTGAVYVVFGSSAPASTGLAAAVQYAGETASDYAGAYVAGGGDVNGDTHPDILVGAPYSDSAYTDAGAAYLILGTGL